MNQEAKVSVIIPTYNSPFLADCLKTVVNQNYKNLEIIVVDDGSTNNARMVCEQFREKDPRVRVFYEDNLGVGAARNTGLNAATGDYVTFVDSDDWITEEYVEVLVNEIQKFDADISVVNFMRYQNSDGTTLFHIDDSNPYEKMYSPQEWFKFEYQPQNFMSQLFTVAWGKLYKRSLLTNIVYPEVRKAEDDYTTWKIYLLANKIVYLNRQFYIFRLNENSTTANNDWHNAFSYKAVLQRIGFFKLIGLDTSAEEEAYRWRLNTSKTGALKSGNYQEYRNIKRLIKMLDKYQS